MKISVVVPTYNRPEALTLCIVSLLNQTVLPDEILIADDGSGEQTRTAILKLQAEYQHLLPIRHIWQEDIGFRKPKIINETVRQSEGDYLIVVDGDCMAHRDFIKAHVEHSAPDRVLAGRRVDLGQRLSKKLISSGKVLNKLTIELLWDLITLKSGHFKEGFVLKNKFLRKIAKRDRLFPPTIVFGCNFSLYKELFYKINGCDEDYLDGSLEDQDIGIRAANQGNVIKPVKNLALLFHLWHPFTWDTENPKFIHNNKILSRRIKNRETVCINGIRRIET